MNGNQANNSKALSGAGYVFVRSGLTWSQEAYLKASNPGSLDGFGNAVGISGDLIVVGASGEDSVATGVDGDQADDSLPGNGAAYVFARDGVTWAQQAYLKPSILLSPAWNFGASVAISAPTVVVGAPLGDAGRGRAFVFEQIGPSWSWQADLIASSVGLGDAFGHSVAVSGDLILVGAPHEDSSAVGVDGNQADNAAGSAGSGYVFVRDAGVWNQSAYLKASNTDAGDIFGFAVSITGTTAVIGSPGEDSGSSVVDGDQSDNLALQAGATYVFDLDAPSDPWANLGLGLPGLAGTPHLAGTGTLVGGDLLSLDLTSAKPSTTTALVIGLTQLAAPFKGGTLVPNPDIVLAGLPVDGAGALSISFAWPTGIPPGVTVYYQHWITDPAGPAGFSASNGVSGTTP